jgi:hypothetical protein
VTRLRDGRPFLAGLVIYLLQIVVNQLVRSLSSYSVDKGDHSHLVPRLRLYGVIDSAPPYALLAIWETLFTFTITISVLGQSLTVRYPEQYYLIITNSMEQSPSWEANSPHFVEPEGSSPYSQEPATCPYPKPDRSSLYPPHPTSRRSIIILSSHLLLGLPSGLLPSGFPTKTLYAPLLSHIRTTCPADLSSWSDHPKSIWWGVQSIKLLVMLRHPSWAQISSSAPYFSKTLGLLSSFSVSDQVSHPYKNKSTVIV